MTHGLTIILEDSIPLADSREIAKQLGIEHRSFFRMILEYQQEVEEDFGILRFKIAEIKRRGQPQKYVLLTENQTYAYMSYSQNTPQARACKRLLVKAFAEAREQLHQLERQQQTSLPPINHLWQKRLALFNERTRIPDGYWCVFNEIAAVCWSLEFQGAHLREDAVPDISVGQMWCKHARHLGLDLSLVRQYPHHYPDRRGVQAANIYPNAWLGAFRDWFQTHYLKHHFPAYLKAHALALPSPEPQPLPRLTS
jgi:phage regulator Rha-like protein